MELSVLIKEMGRISEERHQSVRFSPSCETMTLADLIRETVEAQIRSHLEESSSAPDPACTDLGYLTHAEIKLFEEEGKISLQTEEEAPAGPELSDIPRYQKYALSCFEKGAFVVLVDGRQITDLEDEIQIAKTDDIVFLRVVPFVGG